MLRIGLSGVPGSGKTALAQALKTSIEFADLQCKDCTTPATIIDNYIPEIEDETDLALGFNATYVGNLHTALSRSARERKAWNDYKTIITCGTLYENSTYAAIAFEKEAQFLGEEEKFDLGQRIEATLRAMACFYIDLVRYDYVFYLPPVTNLDPSTTDDTRYLDQSLQAAFNAFNLFPIIPLLNEGDTLEEITKNRLTQALTELNLDGDDRSNAARTEVKA